MAQGRGRCRREMLAGWATGNRHALARPDRPARARAAQALGSWSDGPDVERLGCAGAAVSRAGRTAEDVDASGRDRGPESVPRMNQIRQATPPLREGIELPGCRRHPLLDVVTSADDDDPAARHDGCRIADAEGNRRHALPAVRGWVEPLDRRQGQVVGASPAEGINLAVE